MLHSPELDQMEHLRFDLSDMPKLLLGVLGGDGRWDDNVVARSTDSVSSDQSHQAAAPAHLSTPIAI